MGTTVKEIRIISTPPLLTDTKWKKELADDYTCDICDGCEGAAASLKLRILNMNKLRHLGGRTKFYGRIQTVECPRDNSKLKDELSTPGYGRILVVDAGAETTVAMLGDNIAAKAVENGWAGVVVLGAIRDCAAISKMRQLGVLAMGSCPLRTVRKGLGTTALPLSFFGTIISPNEWMYVDQTGIIVTGNELDMTPFRA